MSYYLAEFLTIVVVHFLAVASPGPDFAVVSRNAVVYGRSAAMATSVGVGCGIMVHVAYCLVGLGLLISQTPALFAVLKYAAAGYLAWLGIQALGSKPKSLKSYKAQTESLSLYKAFMTGFVTNGLNPKATMFFLSLFALVIRDTTPIDVRFAYGVYMMLATALWFSLLSFVFSSEVVRSRILEKGYWFDRVMGCILILLALQLVLSEM